MLGYIIILYHTIYRYALIPWHYTLIYIVPYLVMSNNNGYFNIMHDCAEGLACSDAMHVMPIVLTCIVAVILHVVVI